MDAETQFTSSADFPSEQMDAAWSRVMATPSLKAVRISLRFVWDCVTFFAMTYLNPSIWKEINPKRKSTKRFIAAQRRGVDTPILIQASQEISNLPTDNLDDRRAKSELVKHASRFEEAIRSQETEAPWGDRFLRSKYAIAMLFIGVMLPAIDIANCIMLMRLKTFPGTASQVIPGRVTIIRNVPYDKYLIAKISSIFLILYDGVMIFRFALYTIEICSSPLIVPDIAYLVVLNGFPELYDTLKVNGIIGALSVAWNLFLAYRLIMMPKLTERRLKKGLYSQQFINGCKSILEKFQDHAKIHIRRQEEAQNGGSSLRRKREEFFEPCCIARSYADLNAYKADHIKKTMGYMSIILESASKDSQNRCNEHARPGLSKPSPGKSRGSVNGVSKFTKAKGQQKVILIAAIITIAFAIIPWAYRKVWLPLSSVFGWGVRGFAVLIALYLISTVDEMTSRFNNIMSTALGDVPLNILLIINEQIFGKIGVFVGIYALTFDLNLIHNDIFSTLIFNAVRLITRVKRVEMEPLNLSGRGKEWTQTEIEQMIGLWEFETDGSSTRNISVGE